MDYDNWVRPSRTHFLAKVLSRRREPEASVRTHTWRRVDNTHNYPKQ